MDSFAGERGNCREKILSEQVYDYIIDFHLTGLSDRGEVFCYADIESLYNILYLSGMGGMNPQANLLQYQSVPKLYGLMQTVPFNPKALIAAGITQIQRPPLNLTGRGCVICFIDTGIDYTMPVFQDENGDTRILAIWDQTVQTGTPPKGFAYGSEYKREDINRALRTAEPYAAVPSRDVVGHGTGMAALAAGSLVRSENPYLGAAPEADIVMVKLKECKNYLRQFYKLPRNVPAYQENDIMLAVQYTDSFAVLLKRPVILCLGLGTSMGNHAGSSALSGYLNDVALRRNRAVVVCGGNEGNSAHHFRGNLRTGGNAGTSPANLNIEVRVGDNCSGFTLEFWGTLPDMFQVSLRSPGGESIPAVNPTGRQSVTYGLLYGNTQITVDPALVEASSGEQLLRFRFQDPLPGIWTFQVIAMGEVYNGTFDMWLPIDQFLDAPVYFLSPDPYITLTEPAMAEEVISVTSYDPVNGSFAVNSGRGFSRTGAVRPDLAAPGVNIAAIRGTSSGSSLAAAVTAGAAAQFLQWAVVERNNEFMETRELKSYLIRGAFRTTDLTYPAREWGYGKLDMQGVFERLRGA